MDLLFGILQTDRLAPPAGILPRGGGGPAGSRACVSPMASTAIGLGAPAASREFRYRLGGDCCRQSTAIPANGAHAIGWGGGTTNAPAACTRMRRIDRIAARYADDPILEKFMVKIGNAGSGLFRSVLDPKIPPTNNAAGRELREIAVHRKIRGSIRAEETMTWVANFFSCVMTWKSKKMGYWQRLQNTPKIRSNHVITCAKKHGRKTDFEPILSGMRECVCPSPLGGRESVSRRLVLDRVFYAAAAGVLPANAVQLGAHPAAVCRHGPLAQHPPHLCPGDPFAKIRMAFRQFHYLAFCHFCLAGPRSRREPAGIRHMDPAAQAFHDFAGAPLRRRPHALCAAPPACVQASAAPMPSRHSRAPSG